MILRFKIKNLPSDRQGLKFLRSQAMLVAILIITAAALAIGLAIAALGSSELNSTLNAKQANQAYGLAETCLENTLMKMARNEITAPPNFTASSGNCTINIAGSSPYQITSTGLVGKVTRKIEATVNINSEVLEVTSWQEVY